MKRERYVEDYYLPRIAQRLTGEKKCLIGDALISTIDTCMGAETCEELFTPRSPGLGMGLGGCEIIANSSGRYHELRNSTDRSGDIVERGNLSLREPTRLRRRQALL